MKSLVSILMTVYNRAQYIAEAIESVIHSSYQNWELIIVDDRSSDNSIEIAKKYEKEDERIKIYINEQNLGDYPNRIKAAEYASGKYIKYLDSDDVIYPYSLQIMVEIMDQNNEIGFAFSSKKTFNSPFPIQYNGKNGFVNHLNHGDLFCIGPSSIIFKKEAFDKVVHIWEDNYVGNDELILLELALLFDFIIMQPGLIWWRQHDQQEIRKGNKENEYYIKRYKKINNLLEYAKQSGKILDNKPYKKKLRNYYLGKTVFHIKRGRVKPIYRFVKYSFKNE